jgi:hypothetical protein
LHFTGPFFLSGAGSPQLALHPFQFPARLPLRLRDRWVFILNPNPLDYQG